MSATSSIMEISDNQRQYYQVHMTREAEFFEVCLFERLTHVGYIRCTIDAPDKMTLCDITVLPDALIRRNFLQQVWDRLLGEYPKAKNYQGRGLGTLLLQMAIDEAKRRKIKYIVGTIVNRDLLTNPKLTDWYAKQGFSVAPAESGDLPGAVYQITYTL